MKWEMPLPPDLDALLAALSRGEFRYVDAGLLDRTHLRWFTRQTLIELFEDSGFGIVEFGIPWFLMSTAERHVTSSLTSLIICTVPLFSALFQRVRQTDGTITRRRFTRARLRSPGGGSRLFFRPIRSMRRKIGRASCRERV